MPSLFKRQEHWALALLLVTRLTLGLAYSLINPPWEAYDEDGHMAYVRYLARYHKLLDPNDPEAQQIWEKFQPPLYYILAATSVAWLDLGPAFLGPERNPYFTTGQAGVNYAIHPEQLAGLAQRTTLALLIVRGLGVVMSTISVLFVYGAARKIWPRARGPVWATTSLYAFWPQFLFIGGMVTNDVLVTALAAGVFYLSIALAVDGFQLKRAVLLGLALGAALLTKLTAVALVGVGVMALGFSLTGHSLKRPAHQVWLALIGVSLAVVLALQTLGSLAFVTAQVFQTETVRLFIQRATEDNALRLILKAVPYGFRTFVASFGWGNVEVYTWVYPLWNISAALGVIGLGVAGGQQVRQARRTARTWRLAILLGLQALTPMLLAATLAVAHADPFLIPGRYLLPALPAVSCALIVGWQALVPLRWRGLFLKLASLGLVGLSWSFLGGVIAPSYAKPPALTSKTQIEVTLSAVFNNELELLGYQRPATIIPGTDFRLTLCWQALAPVMKNYPLALEIIGPDGQGYGRRELYPGNGNYPTSFWTMNRPFCDNYRIAARADLPAPALARLQVSLLDGGVPLLVRVGNPSGEAAPAQAAVIPVRVQGQPPGAQPAHEVSYRFGNGLLLKGYEVQGSTAGVVVRLWWEATTDIGEDYTVFVHLRDIPTHAYAQGDNPPRNGWYPTHLWRAGEVVLDEHILILPEGAPPPLDLYVGVVTAEGLRLPVTDAAGDAVLNNEVILEQGWQP